jgi:hypothetical protein
VTSGEERKRLKEEFKGRPHVAGIFAVTNKDNGRVFLGSCLEADRPLRRLRFELQLGSCRNRELQADFDRLGEDSFLFAVLETVPAEAADPSEELELLEKQHLAALDPARSYNQDDRIRFR